MERKFENGCCLTAVMRPKSGVVVTCSGSHSDLCSTLTVMCYELMKSGKLSYDDIRTALTAAVIMESTLS